MRIDQLLVQRGLAGTRSQAQRLIADGVRWRAGEGWQRVSKNGEQVAPEAEIELLDDAEARYVSRGGLKLAGALARVNLTVAGAVCLDLGQSTGGFTDCLLQAGARHVVGVDVGYGQLDRGLRGDSRVTCLERVNARHLSLDTVVAAMPRMLSGLRSVTGSESLKGSDPDFVLSESDPSFADPGFAGFDLIVGDLAFISQTLVLPAVVLLLKPGAALLMLVKPQFELQPGQVGKGGIVTDVGHLAAVEQRIRLAHQELGLAVKDYFASSINGGDGNREFFIHSINVQE